MGDVLAYSGALRRLAVEVGKVASDLRLLSMGPRAGIAEIQLPAVQPGSSIMPGKVNPSVPEMVNQVCYQVFGCDATILAAADAGQLELNVMMPVIAWNALHATTILGQRDARARRDVRHAASGRRGALPRAARSQHRGRHGAEPVHRLRRDGRHRQDRGRDRPLDPRDRARARLLPDDAARRDPVARGDDVARACPGRRQGRSHRESQCVLALVARGRARAGAAQRQSPQRQQHGRLFPPKDLGQLEGPDRDAWQRPDQIMDALGIGEGSVVADLGAGGGWFTVRLARRVGPNGRVYAEDIQPQMIEAIKRRVEREGLQRTSRRCSGRRPIRSCRQAAGRRADRRRVSRDGAAGRAAPQRREGAQAGRAASASSSSQETAAGPGPDMEERVDPETRDPRRDAAGLRADARANFLRYQYMLVFGRTFGVARRDLES